MNNYTEYLTLYTILLGHVKDRLKIITLITIVSIYLGICLTVLQIFIMAMIASAVYLSARVLYRFVGEIMWFFIITTLVLFVDDVNSLLVWTLGFLFGILGITTMDVFLDTKIHHAYLIVFVHLMFFLSAIYAKVDSIATTASRSQQVALLKVGAVNAAEYSEGGSSSVWWCFLWSTVSGSFYSGILEEHNQYFAF